MKRLRELRRILVGLLRELSDEAAYQRHLAAHGSVSTGDQWRRFSEERLRAKFTAPKCC
jgi:hypothetical protein